MQMISHSTSTLTTPASNAAAVRRKINGLIFETEVLQELIQEENHERNDVRLQQIQNILTDLKSEWRAKL